ncbi:TonB-dependent receptor [Sphingobacterium lactis]|uniref:TonB-dependent receptor n=1 Tax=Sphingobacterium lactis TaxID=797291 RepID=UPI003F8004CF
MRYLITLLIIFPLFIQAQEISLKGRVMNKKNQPLTGVNIYISGSYDGAMSDSTGRYRFETVLQGKQTLIFSLAGFKILQKELELKSDMEVNISLEPEAEMIEAVEIRAGQIQVGNKYNAVLSPLDIVTTAGSMGNIIAALEKLPGAQIAGEDGRLMVRGGDPSETQTLVNGIQVFQPYTPTANNMPVRGRFSPFLFKGTNFSTGGYGAEFGNALSGVLNLTTAQEIQEPKTELSFSTVGLGISNTQAWKDNSLSFNLTYTNLTPYTKLISDRIDWLKPFQQASGEAIWRKKGKHSFLNLYATYSFEDFKFKDESVEFGQQVTTDIRNKNAYVNSTYTHSLANNWKIDVGAGLGYSNKDLAYHAYFIPNTQWGSHVKASLRKTAGLKWQWLMGAEHFYQKVDESFQIGESAAVDYGFKRNYAALFTEGNYQIIRGLSLSAGLRYINTLKSQQLVEPRASVGYLINKSHQVSFAYGHYHQEAPEFIAKFKQDLPWAFAKHYVFNYSWLQKGRLLRLEAYAKDYKGLYQYDTPSPQYQSQYAANGFGQVKGIDVFWKDNKSIPNLQYWISYSLTDASKKEAFYPVSVQPTYVAKHQFSIVAKYWISALRSQASITNTYGSGRTYFNPNDVKFPMSKTKGRNDVSVSWSYLLSQQKILFFSMTNVLGNEPIYGYQYRSTADSNGHFQSQAITPNAKHFIFVGFFWTISKNKKDNQLENL